MWWRQRSQATPCLHSSTSSSSEDGAEELLLPEGVLGGGHGHDEGVLAYVRLAVCHQVCGGFGYLKYSEEIFWSDISDLFFKLWWCFKAVFWGCYQKHAVLHFRFSINVHVVKVASSVLLLKFSSHGFKVQTHPGAIAASHFWSLHFSCKAA